MNYTGFPVFSRLHIPVIFAPIIQTNLPSTLLLVDDQSIILDGIEALMANTAEFNVVGTANGSWNVEGLRSGNYFLRISEGSNSWTTPFVKN